MKKKIGKREWQGQYCYTVYNAVLSGKWIEGSRKRPFKWKSGENTDSESHKQTKRQNVHTKIQTKNKKPIETPRSGTTWIESRLFEIAYTFLSNYFIIISIIINNSSMLCQVFCIQRWSTLANHLSYLVWENPYLASVLYWIMSTCSSYRHASPSSASSATHFPSQRISFGVCFL